MRYGGGRLLFRVWQPGDRLEPGVFGRCGLDEQRAIEPDARTVPLLACDREGWRKQAMAAASTIRTIRRCGESRRSRRSASASTAEPVDEVPHGPDDQLARLAVDRQACFTYCHQGMKVMFCGDVVGRAGRDVVLKEVPRLRRELGLDFVVVNGENAAAKAGITGKICAEMHGSASTASPPAIMPGISAKSSLHRAGQTPAAATINSRPARQAGRQPLPDAAWPEDRRRQRHVPAVHGRAGRPVPGCGELISTPWGQTAHFILVDVHGEATNWHIDRPLLRRPGLGRAGQQPRPDGRRLGIARRYDTRPTSACAATMTA